MSNGHVGGDIHYLVFFVTLKQLTRMCLAAQFTWGVRESGYSIGKDPIAVDVKKILFLKRVERSLRHPRTGILRT